MTPGRRHTVTVRERHRRQRCEHRLGTRLVDREESEEQTPGADHQIPIVLPELRPAPLEQIPHELDGIGDDEQCRRIVRTGPVELEV